MTKEQPKYNTIQPLKTSEANINFFKAIESLQRRVLMQSYNMIGNQHPELSENQRSQLKVYPSMGE